MQRHAEIETRETEPPLETAKTLHQSTENASRPEPGGSPNPRPRRLTKSEGQETLGAETHRDRDEGDGATTGGREDTPSTLRLEPPDPDGSMNDGGRAGGTTVPVSRQEEGEPAKKER